jgi:hypothetical protein
MNTFSVRNGKASRVAEFVEENIEKFSKRQQIRHENEFFHC